MVIMYGRKTICIAFFLLFAFSLILTPSLQARNYIWGVESSLALSADTSGFMELTPSVALQSSTITISYTYPSFSRPEGFPLPNRKTPTMINLSIIDAPSWCTATLEEDSFTIPIGSFFKGNMVNETTTLSVAVSDNAPAFSEKQITIQAVAATNGNVQGSEATVTISISAAYVPSVETSVSNTTLSMKPGESKKIAVNVKNNGNANIRAQLSAENVNDSLTVNIPTATTISKNQDVNFTIDISASESLEEKLVQTIVIDILTYATDDTTQEPTTYQVSFQVSVTPEEAENDILDLEPYVLGIALLGILIILVVSFVVVIRRRQLR